MQVEAMDHSLMKLDADKTLLLLGKWGRYQQWTFWLGNAVWLFCGLQLMATAFLGSTPPFHCTTVELSNVTNITTWPEKACRFKENNSNVEQHCGDPTTIVSYDPDFGDTIVSSWNLICNRAYMSEMAASAYFLGFLLGSTVAPGLADKYGRRWPLIIYLFGLASCGTLLSFSSNYILFVIMRILTGIFTSGVGVAGWVLACENVVPSFRAWGLFVQGIWWTTGYCLVGVIAYLLPDWRAMALGLGLPCFLGLTYYWIIPESLHWLVAKNRNDDAKRWIARACHWNKVEINIDDCYSEIDHKFLKKRSFLDVFKSPLLLVQIAIMAYIWFANCFVYYGLSLFTTKLAGNRYVNYILSGAIEVPAYVVLSLGFNHLGRKKTMFIFNSFGCLSLIVLPFLPQTDELLPLITTFWLFGKFSISITFMGAWLYGAEIFPTTMRSTGVGICNVAARSGGMIAPFVRLMGDINPKVPPLVFSVASLLSALVVLMLPETLGINLPDDIDDIIAGPVLQCLKSKETQNELAVMKQLIKSDQSEINTCNSTTT